MAIPNDLASLGDSCCGCGACAAACIKGAVSMAPDQWGFLHPHVEESACVACGACEKICPVLSEHAQDGAEAVWWAKARDAALKERSSSGGVFGLLALETLRAGGIVVGAAFDGGCKSVRHAVVDSEAGLDSVMRSKYVQSSVGIDVYEGVKSALRADRKVLFSGTACQVVGMRGYLGKLADSPLFLSVDVICHGVPSPKLWSDWVGYLNDREDAEISRVNFRSKTTGWLSYSVSYEYETEKDGATRQSANKFADDWYMKAFLNNASLRASCFDCPCKRSCGSDITLGDFWGFQNIHPEVNYEKGVSAVICNTPKGRLAFDAIADALDGGASSLEEVLPGNPSLLGSVAPYARRTAFMADLARGGVALVGCLRDGRLSRRSSSAPAASSAHANAFSRRPSAAWFGKKGREGPCPVPLQPMEPISWQGAPA